MYPTLSALLNDLLGIDLPLPIQMFGFMVAMAFLAGGYVIKLELKRKQEQGLFQAHVEYEMQGLPASSTELLSNGIFGFLLGFKLSYIIANYAAFVQDPPGTLFSLDGYFVVGVLAAAALAYYTYSQKEKNKLDKPIKKEVLVFPHEQVGTILIVAAVAGLIGAKIFHNLENLDDFSRDPIGSLLSFSGLTFYGGLLCGLLAVYFFARKNKMNFAHLLDAGAPGLLLAYAIGRIGCQLSGDGDWGIENTQFIPDFLPTWFWSFKYPHNVLGEGVAIAGCIGRHCNELPVGVFPTPLYEAIACFILFTILWVSRKKIQATGLMFSIYLVMNGLERFMIEKIRVNSLYHLGSFSFTQAELISSLLMIAGLIGIFYSTRKKQLGP